MGPNTLITLSLGVLICITGAALATGQENLPAIPAEPSEQDDPTSSGSVEGLDQQYYDLHNWRAGHGPPPGKRSAIPSSLEDPSEQDDPASSGSVEGLDQQYYDLHNWRPGQGGPPPGKRSAIRSSLGARDFIRGGKLWKRVNRQRFDEDY